MLYAFAMQACRECFLSGNRCLLGQRFSMKLEIAEVKHRNLSEDGASCWFTVVSGKALGMMKS